VRKKISRSAQNLRKNLLGAQKKNGGTQKKKFETQKKKFSAQIHWKKPVLIPAVSYHYNLW
jgi:hypothetical protein